MLTDDLKSQIEKATITITGKMGRGVLVAGNLVLTVAHCVEFSCEYPMADDFFLEAVRTDVEEFRLTPYAVEPCHDVAALGELDGQQPAFSNDVEMFELFCERTTPLRLCLKEFELFRRFPVYVYTHEGKWVTGSAQQCRVNAPSLFVEFDDLIKGGTSGSAIVKEDGEIVALVSIAGGTDENDSSGPSPRPHLALPVWTVENIRSNYA